MRNPSAIENETIVTVTAVKAPGNLRKEIERLGIMAGSDIRKVSANDDGSCIFYNGRKDVLLSAEMLQALEYSAQFKRHYDPVFYSGCCAYGDTIGMINLVEETFAKMEAERALDNSIRKD